MTATKLFPLSLLVLLASCGRDVSIPNRLESVSLVNAAESQNTASSGTLVRKSNSADFDRLLINGRSYKISMHSSYQALEFIAAKEMGATVSVQFKGKIMNQEVVLEEMK